MLFYYFLFFFFLYIVCPSQLREKHSQTTRKTQSIYEKNTVKTLSCEMAIDFSRKCDSMTLKGGVCGYDFWKWITGDWEHDSDKV